MTNVYQHNARGGLATKNGHRVSGSADWELTLDFEAMGLIPGGVFLMGEQNADERAPNYYPRAKSALRVHRVSLSPYFLSKYECTQAQWRALTGGQNPSRLPAGKRRSWDDLKPITPRHPVSEVTWQECATWLSRWGLELPSEAQWENGCRAGTTTPWFTGSEPASLQGFANISDAYLASHGGQPTWRYTREVDDGHTAHAPVGSFRPNAFGLHDVHGNVFEWCRDTNTAYALSRTLRLRAPVRDPVVEAFGAQERVFRGGSWLADAEQVRSANRYFGVRTHRRTTGVRPARSVYGLR